MRAKLTVVLGAILLGRLGDCGNDPLPPCDPCDPVALLRMSPLVMSGAITPVPDAIENACGQRKIDPRRLEEWEENGCEEITAHYVVRSLDWDPDDLEESWQRQAGYTFACQGYPDYEDRSGGCCAASPDRPQDLVGPTELESDSLSSVALLVPSEALLSPKEDALQQNLPTLIQDVIENESCEFVKWVYDDPCTAFLVGDRHMLTTRHCVNDPLPLACGGTAPNELTNMALVFDYDEQPLEGTEVIYDMTVVACGDDDGLTSTEDEHDWVLLELPEPPSGDRQPLTLPTADNGPSKCELIYSIGHPVGHPQFRSGTTDPTEPSAWVRKETEWGGAFYVTLDVVSGFSGAPVLSLADDRLLGLLVSGRFRAASADPGCERLLECGAAGCADERQHGVVLDLSRLHDVIAPLVAS